VPSRQSACRLILRGGAHRDLIGKDTVTFVLRAPHKPFVSLVGDFNAWDTRRHPLQTDGEGTWWVTVPDPGRTRYGFYVIVDNDTHAWVGDPYAREVQWSQYTPWGVLPGREAPFAWHDVTLAHPAAARPGDLRIVRARLCRNVARRTSTLWQLDAPDAADFAPDRSRRELRRVDADPGVPRRIELGLQPCLLSRHRQHLRRPARLSSALSMRATAPVSL
jgi:hypothetical protein